MYWMKQQSRQENLMYLTMWVMLFVAPILSLYVRSLNDDNIVFQWNEIWMIWQKFAVFLLLFLVHNFLLAPLLVYQHKRVLYFAITCSILAVFTVYQCTTRPDDIRPRHRHPMEMREDRHGMDMDRDGRPHFHEENGPMHRHKHPKMRHNGPPLFIGEHDIIAVVMLILMFGMNVGIKGFFKSREDHKKLVALEKENLAQQLEYLKYQINPHFLMNTLNNIHALIDIDPEKAQETVLELSKMLRFILYEGDKNGVPLSKEFEFIRTYITLMRLRYTDKVSISVELPQEAPDKTVPPLILISFIENAFKHGISYQHPSFIDIRVDTAHERLRFRCRNSKAEKSNQEKGGVGLANVKQRLHLLYDNNFTLTIQDETDVYNVELIIPLT